MYKLREVVDKVWVVEFDSYYNLGMTFLRYQEYYESPNPKFFRNPFMINEYKEWYSGGDEFTYHMDWLGFNIPSKFILECQSNIPDHNEWDKIMSDIVTKVIDTSGDTFYLLGIKEGDNDVLDHEVAHGLFFTDKAYQIEMTSLYNDLPDRVRNKVHSYLRNSGGYSEEVFMDETQAYMSTGLPHSLLSVEKYSKPFEEVFKRFFSNSL